ncbi:unnamed protein product [Ilex paraguariensis]|uniref:Uncharacterized protein n=1 Tax=Ilex paraguariensis TaxID=185542 RepID=A0ABC8SUD6_9AQUA
MARKGLLKTPKAHRASDCARGRGLDASGMGGDGCVGVGDALADKSSSDPNFLSRLHKSSTDTSIPLTLTLIPSSFCLLPGNHSDKHIMGEATRVIELGEGTVGDNGSKVTSISSSIDCDEDIAHIVFSYRWLLECWLPMGGE